MPAPLAIADELEVLIRARYPLLYIVSWEDERVLAILREIAHRRGKQVFLWAETTGLEDGAMTPGGVRPQFQQPFDPLAVLDHIRSADGEALFVLRDFHPFFQPPFRQGSAVVRKLRDLTAALPTSHKTIIILSPVLSLPPELEKECTVIDFPLPTLDDLEGLLNRVLTDLENNKRPVSTNAQQEDQVLHAALGLTLLEAENVFARCLVQLGALDVDTIVAEKEQIIRKSGILEYYHPDERFEHIGGLDNLKLWLRARGKGFTQEAQQFGLPYPTGLLLLGVQGCGKSLTAKAVASLWHMPLLRLDIGRIFAGLVGQSEENVRKAIRLSEAVSPCVLWIDEIEKGFAGTRGEQMDTGVGARVFGTFITWLQEKKKPVFVVATANQIESLPPELLRRGRFDEIFFVDLPSPAERADIFGIHLTRRRRDPKGFDLPTLAAKTEGYSGAEIEAAVVEGLFRAFDAGRELTQADLAAAVTDIIPLSQTMKEDIDYLRHWAQGRTRPASQPP